MATQVLHSANPNFSFEKYLHEGFNTEALYGDYDAGPVDSEPSEIHEQSYGMFFGSSSLSKPSPPAPRGSSPEVDDTQANLRQNAQHKRSFSGAFGSPLPSSAPSSASSPPESPSNTQGSLPASVNGVDNHEGSKSRRNKKKSKSSRKARRAKEREDRRHAGYKMDNGALRRHTSSAKPTSTEFHISDIQMANPGYTGLRDTLGRIYTLDELLDDGLGFRLVKWDGKTSVPILADKRIIGVLAGSPNDPQWDDVQRNAFNVLTASRDSLQFPPNTLDHRRGVYPALSCGISHGGGQVRPGNLRHQPHNDIILQSLVSNPDISRIAGFSNGAFALWAPKLYDYYETHFESLLNHYPSLRRNYPNSVWAAMCFNFGPQTVTREHTDFANLPFGWCAITSLGQFDPTKGGQLVLWKLNLVIEFPPGSTILIPSATIPHGNVPIGEHEQRCSITQFSAGGLFRWVDYGFRSSAKYTASIGPQEQAHQVEERKKLGLSLFSTFEQLHADQRRTNAP